MYKLNGVAKPEKTININNINILPNFNIYGNTYKTKRIRSDLKFE